MPLLTEAEVLRRAERLPPLSRRATRIVATESLGVEETYDVFLSHSSNEPEQLLRGIVDYLEAEDLTVYVDRYDDPQISPERVTRATAVLLRRRLRSCRSLLYVHSPHSGRSRWMPWELGFMDGAGRRVGIIPVSRNRAREFSGEEYLGLYPYVDRMPSDASPRPRLWITRTADRYQLLRPWIAEGRAIALHE